MIYSEGMRDYEIVLVFTPDKSKEVRDKVLEKVKKDLESLGGKVTSEDEWGKKQLAYRIKKENEAFFVYWEVAMEPASLNGLEQKMKLNEEILRYLLVRKDEVSKKPQKKVLEKSEPVKSKKAEEAKKERRAKK
ncbi:MAG: 30S ribosomal protein S6 [bacterium]|nr:30S ribosomal protein S6 [bacterium]